MIEIEYITKIFRSLDGADVLALQDVSFGIGLGEFVSIVGPSGCGKSTLLRLIAGLTAPTDGRITIDGTEVTEPSRDIGMVFQAPTLLPWANVLKNVLFPLRILHRQTPDSGHRAREILLMDEPFGALDALTREEMGLELQRIWTERPTTIVFVTHSVQEAVLLSDRVCVMSARPGHVREMIEIPLPRPRSYSQETEREFQNVVQRIRKYIFDDPKSAERTGAA